MIDFAYSHLFIGLGILAALLAFLARQGRSFWYLLFFSIFGIYLLIVVSVVVFPIVPLLPEDPFKPRLNLIPFYFGRCDMPELCVGLVVENILLTVPFGFGISFILSLKPGDFFWLTPLVGFALEVIQLVVSFAFRSAFRAIDINDVILNAAGVLLGYGIFRLFGYLYLSVTHKFEMHHKFLFAYIHNVVRQSTEY